MPDSLSSLFETFQQNDQTRFPRDLAGDGIFEIDFVMLAADTHAVISTFLGRKGTHGKMSEAHYLLLLKLESEYNLVLPNLKGEGYSYFKAHYNLVIRVLDYLKATNFEGLEE